MRNDDKDVAGAIIGTGFVLGCAVLFWASGIAVAAWIVATVWHATM